MERPHHAFRLNGRRPANRPKRIDQQLEALSPDKESALFFLAIGFGINCPTQPKTCLPRRPVSERKRSAYPAKSLLDVLCLTCAQRKSGEQQRRTPDGPARHLSRVIEFDLNAIQPDDHT